MTRSCATGHWLSRGTAAPTAAGNRSGGPASLIHTPDRRADHAAPSVSDPVAPPSCALRAGPDSSPSHPETAAPRRPLQDVPRPWTRPGGGRASTAPRPTDGCPPAAQNRASRLLDRWDRQGKNQGGRAARRNADSRRRRDGGEVTPRTKTRHRSRGSARSRRTAFNGIGAAPAGSGLIAKARYHRRVGRCDTPPATGFALPFPCHGRCAKDAFASPMSIAILDLIGVPSDTLPGQSRRGTGDFY